MRWLLIGWLFVISAVSYLDRVNISIAGQAMAAEHGLSRIQLGNVFSAFVLGYALFQAPGGWIADRLGPRRTLTFGLLWWGVFTALTAAVPSLLLLLIVRFGLGTGEAVVYPSSNRLVADWVPANEQGRANGIIFAGVGAGAGLAPPLIVYFMQQHGWRSSFYASALIGVAVAAVWFLMAKDRPSTAVKDAQRPSTPWRAIFASRELTAMSLSYFAYGYAAWIFFSWFFIYLNAVRGLDLKASRYYAMLPFLAMAVCSPFGGWISDALSRARGLRIGRSAVAAISMVLAAVFIATATQVSSARLASVILAGGAGARYLSQSSFFSVTAEIAGPCAGTVSGIMNMGGQIGATVTATLTPVLAERFGWTTSFVTAAVLCAAGGFAWLAVDPLRKLFR